MNGPVRVQKYLTEQIAEERIYRCHLYQQVIKILAHADSQGSQNGKKARDILENQATKRWWRVGDQRQTDKETADSVLWDKGVRCGNPGHVLLNPFIEGKRLSWRQCIQWINTWLKIQRGLWLLQTQGEEQELLSRNRIHLMKQGKSVCKQIC